MPGGGEAHLDLPKGSTLGLTATMELLDATRATTPSTIRVSTTTDDTHLTCEDGRDPFPLTDATRRAHNSRPKRRTAVRSISTGRDPGL